VYYKEKTQKKKPSSEKKNYFETLQRGEARTLQKKLKSDPRYGKLVLEGGLFAQPHDHAAGSANKDTNITLQLSGNAEGQMEWTTEPAKRTTERKARAMSMAVTVKLAKKTDFAKPKLQRSSSEPFLHSWDYNNIDVTQEIPLPGGGTLYDYLVHIWSSKRAMQKKKNLMRRPGATKLEAIIKEMNSEGTNSPAVPEVKDELTELVQRISLGDDIQEIPNVQEDPIRIVNEEGKSIIVAGSKYKLIQALITGSDDDKNCDSDFIATLVMTHEHWISAEELFSTLEKMYWKAAESAKDSFNTTKVFALITQRKIVEVIKTWIETNYICFSTSNPKTLKQLFTFVAKLGKGSQKEVSWGELLSNTVKAIGQEHQSIVSTITPALKKKKKKSKWKDASKVQFLELDPVDLARQMAIFDLRMIQKVTIPELLNQNWNKGKGQNASALRARNELVSSWVATEIINTPNEKNRIVVLNNFITLCFKLMEYKNYNGFLNIYFGLKKDQVTSLKRTWNGISSKLKGPWSNYLEKMMTVNGFTEFFEKNDICRNSKSVTFFFIYAIFGLTRKGVRLLSRC